MQRTILFTLALLLPAATLCAQQAPTPPREGSNWQHVQALPGGTSIYLRGRTQHRNCTLDSVDADTLTCSDRAAGKAVVIPRAEIQSIRIGHRGRSTLLAAGIGAGIGAILGAIAHGPGCTAAERNSFLGCFDIVTRADLAALGAGSGAVIGAPIGYFTDMSRSTVYKAP